MDRFGEQSFHIPFMLG